MTDRKHVDVGSLFEVATRARDIGVTEVVAFVYWEIYLRKRTEV